MLYVATNQKRSTVEQALVPALKLTGSKFRFIPIPSELPNLPVGDALLLCGSPALPLLQQAGFLDKKKRSMTSLRNRDYGGRYVVTFNPSLIYHDESAQPHIDGDVQLAARVARTGSGLPEVGDYRYVLDFSESMAHVKEMSERGLKAPLFVDLETIGLDPYRLADHEHPGAQILSVSITYKAGQADIVRTDENGQLSLKQKTQLLYLLCGNDVKLMGANIKYDLLWLWVHYGIVTDRVTFDTQLVGTLLHEHYHNSLNLHAKMYTTMGGYDDLFNQSFDKSRMDLAFEAEPEKCLVYAGGDTDSGFRTATIMKAKLTQDFALTRFYVELLQPASQVFLKLEKRGVLVDKKRYLELKDEVSARKGELEHEILSLFPRRIKHKYHDALRLTRHSIIREYLFTRRGLNLQPEMLTEKDQLPSTAKEHYDLLLEKYPDHPDLTRFVQGMHELGSANKTLSTYIVGFMKHIRSDGKFHPSYMLFRGVYGDDDADAGARSGRTSCKDPAAQTIPKHTIWAKPLRTVYVPPEGMAILKVDFSQGELKVTACVANEPVMIDAYRKGIDMHLKTGAAVAGISFEEALRMKEAKDPALKQVRQGGKAGNFGLIYDISPEGFRAYARLTYGVHLTLQEAITFGKTFFTLYPGLIDWQNTYRKLAHKYLMVRSPLGRIRHLPLANSFNQSIRSKQERQAINSPIQSTLSDMMLLAMVELDRSYPDLWIFSMTHDDIGMYVPLDDVIEWGVKVRDVMENLPLERFGWKPQLKFTVDAEWSPVNLAECKDLTLPLAS